MSAFVPVPETPVVGRALPHFPLCPTHRRQRRPGSRSARRVLQPSRVRAPPMQVWEVRRTRRPWGGALCLQAIGARRRRGRRRIGGRRRRRKRSLGRRRWHIELTHGDDVVDRSAEFVAFAAPVRVDAPRDAGGQHDSGGGAERRQPARVAPLRVRPRRRYQLRIQRAMRHRMHGRIELRIGFGLRQLAIERSQTRVLLVHEDREFALEFFVAAHSFNFSRNFANA